MKEDNLEEELVEIPEPEEPEQVSDIDENLDLTFTSKLAAIESNMQKIDSMLHAIAARLEGVTSDTGRHGAAKAANTNIEAVQKVAFSYDERDQQYAVSENVLKAEDLIRKRISPDSLATMLNEIASIPEVSGSFSEDDWFSAYNDTELGPYLDQVAIELNLDPTDEDLLLGNLLKTDSITSNKKGSTPMNTKKPTLNQKHKRSTYINKLANDAPYGAIVELINEYGIEPVSAYFFDGIVPDEPLYSELYWITARYSSKKIYDTLKRLADEAQVQASCKRASLEVTVKDKGNGFFFVEVSKDNEHVSQGIVPASSEEEAVAYMLEANAKQASRKLSYEIDSWGGFNKDYDSTYEISDFMREAFSRSDLEHLVSGFEAGLDIYDTEEFGDPAIFISDLREYVENVYGEEAANDDIVNALYGAVV